MKDSNLASSQDVFTWIKYQLAELNKPENELKRINIKYAFLSLAVTAVALYAFGTEWHMLLGAAFLQSIYFFGQKVTKTMFKILLVVLIGMLAFVFLYKEAIVKTGLEADLDSKKKTEILKQGLEWENPSVDLQELARGLIAQKKKAYEKFILSNQTPEDSVRYVEVQNRLDKRIEQIIQADQDLKAQQAKIKNSLGMNDDENKIKNVSAPQYSGSGLPPYRPEEDPEPDALESGEVIVNMDTTLEQGMIVYRASFTLSPNQTTSIIRVPKNYKFDMGRNGNLVLWYRTNDEINFNKQICKADAEGLDFPGAVDYFKIGGSQQSGTKQKVTVSIKLSPISSEQFAPADNQNRNLRPDTPRKRAPNNGVRQNNQGKQFT